MSEKFALARGLDTERRGETPQLPRARDERTALDVRDQRAIYSRHLTETSLS